MFYSTEIVERIWEKGRAVPEQDPATWRKDECGAWMRREHYAREDSEYGWKIVNVSPGGPDIPENLRPFHFQNSFDLGANRAKCRITADQRGIDPHEHLHEAPRNRPLHEELR